jgi:hypothetical protein
MVLSGESFKKYTGSLSPLMMVGLVFVAAGAAGLAVARQPWMTFAALLALPFGLALLIRPELAVLAVVFGVYSNAPVLGVKFHNVPYIVGAAFPLLLLLPLAVNLLFLRRKLVLTPLMPLMIAYLGVQLLSALFSGNIRVANENVMIFMIEGIGLYFLIVNLVRTQVLLRQVIWALLLAGILIGGIPLYQQITGTFENNYGGFAQISEGTIRTGEETVQGDIRQPRLAGAIGEQNRYAQVMLMLVPLGLFRFWGERSPRLKLLALAATGLAAIGMALAFSRGAAVGFALMLLLMVFTRNIKPIQFAALVATGVLLLAAFPQYRMRLTSLEAVFGVIAPTENTTNEELDGAMKGRATAMLGAAYTFADHPLIGVGPGMTKNFTREYGNRLNLRTLTENREAHSLYLDVAADTGILGLICFMGILFVTLRGLIGERKRWLSTRPELASLITGLLLALVSYLTTGLFLHLSFARYFWLIIALAQAAIMISRQEAPSQALEPTIVEAAGR